MTAADVWWETVDDPERSAVQVIDDGLDEYNHGAAEFSAIRSFACVARDEEGTVVGGAIARIWGSCCEIQQIWVQETRRMAGIGRHLVKMVEEHALRGSCLVIYLETFSFQSPEFYRRLGYRTACEFTGFPNGVTKLIMRKDLA